MPLLPKKQKTYPEKRIITMARKFNFSAGPAMLPTAVMERAQQEMLEWNGSGMSVMEMSHRGKEYMSIAAKAEKDLREVMSIPDNYKVLFLQGGASSQFAMVPLNLLGDKDSADYLNTGMWSKKAIAEAKRFCTVNIVADTSDNGFTTVPTQAELNLNPDAAYVHYTPNETIGGVEFDYIPETGDVPLVADMSSTILSRPIDVSRFALIYAGAQKNIGPAGLTIVIIREDLLGNALEQAPAMFNYKTHADNGSMYNTPATYSWYMAGLVFEWIKEQGGLEAIGEINKRKADKLYAVIDNSDFYGSPVARNGRSWMNVPFTLANADLDAAFLAGAAERGLVTLKGHRSVGGMRASIYNAMPEEGVDALVAWMQEFERNQE
jgi:phosphoserine aminotransferase